MGLAASALGVVFLLSFAAPGLAADGEAARKGSGIVFRDAIAGAFETAVLQQQDQAGLAEWQTRMELAQAKRSRGIRFLFIGIGMGVGGTVLAASGTSSLSVDRLGNIEDSGSGLRAIGVMTVLGGAGAFWYGVYNWLKGSDEVDNLDREGRMKGYLALVPVLAPVPGGGAQLVTRLEF